MAEELAEMETALTAEARLQSGVGFLDLFRNPVDRRRTVVAVLALTTQAASGAMFLICTSPYPLFFFFISFHPPFLFHALSGERGGNTGEVTR